MSDQFNGFKPSFYKFFKELSENNNRDWFTEHKDRYKGDVIHPLVDFITDFAPRLEKISKHYVADPRVNGGSIFRIYRDVRFSKDKRPYKEHGACQFRHRMKNDVHAPGFYIHLDPKEIFFGAGIWVPPADELFKIRTAIVEKESEWKRVKKAIVSSSYFDGIEGEGLKRAPKGFDAEHPQIEDLKRKSFFAMRKVKASVTKSPEFIDEVEATFKATKPFMKFLTSALDVPF